MLPWLGRMIYISYWYHCGIKNNSDKECIYGEFFLLEQKFNNSWYEVPVIIDGNYGFNSIGYELSPGDSGEWEIDWDWLYGSLEAGQYRIIKDILDFRDTGILINTFGSGVYNLSRILQSISDKVISGDSLQPLCTNGTLYNQLTTDIYYIKKAN